MDMDSSDNRNLTLNKCDKWNRNKHINWEFM